MNQDDAKRIKRNKIIVAAGLGIFIVIVVFISFFASTNRKINKDIKANIENISDCAKNADTQDLNSTVSATIYANIKVANSYNGKSTADNYNLQIRKDSCSQTSSGNTNSATVIVDVPEAKQSWVVNYSWFDNISNTVIGNPGDTQVSCPSSDQLKYGDFHCQAALNSQTAANCGAAYADNKTTPGYQNFGTIKTGGQWALDESSMGRIQNKLNNIIDGQNAGKSRDDQIACVLAVANDNAQVATPYVNVVTSWQVEFITWKGDETTHYMTYTVDMDYNQTVALDSQAI